MADWILVSCLVKLRTEFNEVAPGRDRSSDGSIGDTAHAGGGTSDHLPDEDFPVLRSKDGDVRNEVHAIDVDADLRTPGLSMEQVVQHLLSRCRSGAETRLRYIIFNRRIWEASNGWRQRAYTGPNPHDKHAHFSASYDTAREASTASWHLEDLMALSADDKKWLGDLFAAVAGKVWGLDADQATPGTQTAGGLLLVENRRSSSTTNRQLPALAAAVAQLAARQVDPAVLVGALVPALTDAIVAALPRALEGPA